MFFNGAVAPGRLGPSHRSLSLTGCEKKVMNVRPEGGAARQWRYFRPLAYARGTDYARGAVTCGSAPA